MNRCHALGFAALLAGLPLVAQTTAGSGSRVVESAPIDPRQGINFASSLWPERVYVGQQATYEIGIFLSETMLTRLRRNPQFVPPDVRSMIAYDLPIPGRPITRQEGNRTFNVHLFSRALFPLTPGVHEISAARLEYAVPLSSSIFAREESHTARSQPHRLLTLEPPVAGRPADYHGAVGRLALGARLDTVQPRVGDPLLLTLIVRGVGNVSLFPRPQLRIPWAQAVPGPERVRVDSSAILISGTKEFDWVLTPAEPGSHEVPAIRYPYFNPYTEQYEVALTQPLGVRVRPGGLATPVDDVAAGEARLSIRRVWRGPLGLPVAASPVFWAGMLLAPIPALYLRSRRRTRPVRRVGAREALRRLSMKRDGTAVDVRRQAHAALSERVPHARSTFGGDSRRMERALRRAGVSLETAQETRALFSRLDEAAYAREAPADPELAARALHLLDAVDAEAVPVAPRPRRARRGLWVVLLAWTGAGSLASATIQTRHASLFAEGVAAWDSGDVDGARQRFAELARAEPRAADAWANLGTASWHAADTAASVVGWQRALRLEPLATDVRERLAATPSFRDGLLGDIPPVPPGALVALGALLWVTGWGWLAAGTWKRSSVRIVPRVLGASVVVALLALVVSERLSGRRQFAVLATDRLRNAPAVIAETGAGVVAGETAQLVATQGVWHKVRFFDGREGWMERRALESLEIPAAR